MRDGRSAEALVRRTTHRRSFSLAAFDFVVAGSDFHSAQDHSFDFHFIGCSRRVLGFTHTHNEPWNRLAERLFNGPPTRVDFYERTTLSRLSPPPRSTSSWSSSRPTLAVASGPCEA